MGNLLVRDVPDDVLERLKARAKAHGRSAEAEHREILRQVLLADDGSRFDTLARRLRAITADRQQTPSEDLLRDMRDER